MLKFFIITSLMIPFFNASLQAEKLSFSPYIEIIKEKSLVGTKIGKTPQAKPVAVRYESYCGRKAKGLVVQEFPQKKIYKIGVVIGSDPVRCSSINQWEWISLSSFNLRPDFAIKPFTPRERKGKFEFASIPQLDHKPGQIKPKALGKVLSFREGCSDFIGIYVGKPFEGPRDLPGVGVVVYSSKGAQHNDSEECSGASATPAKAHIGFVRPEIRKNAILMNAAPKYTRPVRLRYTAAQKQSFRYVKGAGLQIRYERRCNEKPLGVFVSEKAVRQQRVLFTSLIVLADDNHNCLRSPSQDSKSKVETYVFKGFNRPEGIMRWSIGSPFDGRSSQLSGVQIRAPKLKMLNSQGKIKLAAGSKIGACEKFEGYLLGKSTANMNAVGLVVSTGKVYASNSKFSCRPSIAGNATKQNGQIFPDLVGDSAEKTWVPMIIQGDK